MAFYNLPLLAGLLCALSTTVHGHIQIAEPAPFTSPQLTTSPLNNAAPGSSGSNFPCQLASGGSYKVGTRTQVAVGQQMPLSFSGSASHGGGTCQLAVTTDQEPSVKTQWKTFQIYEGGCPIAEDSSSGGTSNLTYTLPSGMVNGDLTFAWIWYNRIGNREIYMNCAPITVTGGSSDTSVYDALPNAYIINLPTSECSSVEMSDQIIPNPGNAVVSKGGAASVSLVSATGPSCAASAAAMTQGVAAGSGSGSAATTAASAATDAASSAATSAAAAGTTAAAAHSGAALAPSGASAAATSVAPTTLITMPAASATSLAATSAQPAVAATTSAAAAAAAPTIAAGNSTSSGSGSSSGGLVCSSDGTQFGLINPDGATVMQPVAPGTTCTNGQITKRDGHFHARRHARFMRS